MASASNPALFLTRLHRDIRYIIYDFVAQDQTYRILCPSHTDLTSLSWACKTTKDETEAWYKKNKSLLHKIDKGGIFHPPSAIFLLDVADFKVHPPFEITKGHISPPTKRLSPKTMSEWVRFVHGRMACEMLEHLVIDLRLLNKPGMTSPVDLIGTDIIFWVTAFKKLSTCELIMTSEQRENWDAIRCDLDDKSFARSVSSSFLARYICFNGIFACGKIPAVQLRICDMARQTEVVEIVEIEYGEKQRN